MTSFAFDPVSRLSTLTQNPTGTANDITLGFTYNPASQIATATRSTDVYAWGGHYNVNRAYGTNGLNQLTTAGVTALSYDLRGNLTASGASAYGYTSENLLITGPTSASLSYDPAMRLYQTVGAGVTTRFGYDGANLIAEYNASNTLLRRYVHGPGSDEPLVWYEGSTLTDRRFLHADERGSVIAISDGTGAVTTVNKYDEYGIPAATNAGRFQYTGQTWLPELGMYYYKARIYSPTLGRFMQTDPIGYGDGMNWYDYVGGDPVNGTDPSGKSCADVGTYSNAYCDPSNKSDDGPVIKVTGKRDWNRGPNIFERIWAAISGKCDTQCNMKKILDRHQANSIAPVADSGGFDVTSEPQKEALKPPCISPNDGPVIYAGGGFDAVILTGAGVSFSKFKIPTTGATGWVATGSWLFGGGGGAGVSGGAVASWGQYNGDGYRLAAGAGEVIFDSEGNVAGGGGAFGKTIGAYGGFTKTKLISSNVSICGPN